MLSRHSAVSERLRDFEYPDIDPIHVPNVGFAWTKDEMWEPDVCKMNQEATPFDSFEEFVDVSILAKSRRVERSLNNPNKSQHQEGELFRSESDAPSRTRLVAFDVKIVAANHRKVRPAQRLNQHRNIVQPKIHHSEPSRSFESSNLTPTLFG